MKKSLTRGTLALHVSISLLAIAAGIYVLIEKKMIISGILSGGLYEFDFIGSLLVALSFFLFSVFSMLVLFQEKKYIKKICEWLFIISMLSFVVGAII